MYNMQLFSLTIQLYYLWLHISSSPHENTEVEKCTWDQFALLWCTTNSRGVCALVFRGESNMRLSLWPRVLLLSLDVKSVCSFLEVAIDGRLPGKQFRPYRLSPILLVATNPSIYGPISVVHRLFLVIEKL